jgi:hypothetical protein
MDAEPREDEHFIREGETPAIEDDVAAVEFRKICTPAGERLEVESPAAGSHIRLDAIELEALTWQNAETYLEFIENAGDAAADTDLETRAAAVRELPREDDPEFGAGDRDGRARSDSISVTNEFAEARVRSVEPDAGERIEIEAPKLGHVVHLAPVELESVTWQSSETFTGFLETPFGPDDH